MILKVSQLPQFEWEKISEEAFVASFGSFRPKDLERYDFALMLERFDGEEKDIAAFITCKEMDSETLYWQFGGVLPKYEKTCPVYTGYQKFILWAKERYKRVTTRIENKNYPMLKMAMRAGFLVVGTYAHKDKLYLELVNEFDRA